MKQRGVRLGVLLLPLLLLSAAPENGAAEGGQVRSEQSGPRGPTYAAQEVRDISVFGARLSMRLEDARTALVRSGFTRQPFPESASSGREAQVLEADYRHPSQNTSVGLFYAELPNGERRIGRIVLWEQIPVIDRAAFDGFLIRRYGSPILKTLFQGHDTYVWSQAGTSWRSLLTSMQCMMSCLARNLVGQCSPRTISGQVFMSGGFNANMPGQLYWGADLNDLEIQRAAMLRGGRFPEDRPICFEPVR